jgi:hypothetical protein
MKEQTHGLNSQQITYCRHGTVKHYDDTGGPSSDGRTVTLNDALSQDRQYVSSTLRSPQQ